MNSPITEDLQAFLDSTYLTRAAMRAYRFFVGVGHSRPSPVQKEEASIREDGSSAGPASKPFSAAASPERTVLKVNTITKLLYTLTSLTNKPSPEVMGTLIEALRRQLR
jgi:hypothetical protein